METLDPPAATRSRYRLTRVQGQGGLGKVWLANDRDLNRDVALKEVLLEGDFREAEWRLHQEAQITGQLQHPNIVPVYELGRDPLTGHPFYTMKFVGGRTLDAAIREYHAARRDDVASSLTLHSLLRAFVGVCEAIAYAHDRGVIHRDLKPLNVVLGDYGEAVLLDWGLAKKVSEPEADRWPAIMLSDEALGGATAQGSQPGTPAYMAPEQAQGRGDLVGPTTDVYGLGAILFEILTGQAPHHGIASADLFREIANGPSPRARDAESSADPALDAVCARAMARDRADRYPSAKDLAAEVNRWLADEAVSVYRGSMSTRLARWGRRNRKTATWTAALMLTALATLSVASVWIARERDRAEANAAEALANFELARGAVDGLLIEVGDVNLAEVPQMEPIRKRLLDKAGASYRAFLDRHGDDPSIRLGAGHALGRLGDILALNGEDAEATSAYERSLAILRPQAEAEADRDARRDLAHSLHGLGLARKSSNKLADAEQALREAIRLREGLTTAPDDLRDLADSRYHLGALLARMGRRGTEQEASYRQAIATQEALASANPNPALRARYLNNLGILLRASGRLGEADQAFRGALDLKGGAVGARSTLPARRWQAARAANNLGTLASANDALSAHAQQLYEWSRATLEGLADEFPAIAQYRRELALVDYNLAVLHERLGRLDEATTAYRRAVNRVKPLVDGPSGRADDLELFEASKIGLDLLPNRPEPIGALRSAEGAVEALEALVASYPEIPSYRRTLARSSYLLGQFRVEHAQPAKARRDLDRAITLHRRLLLDAPEDPAVLEALCDDLDVQAQAHCGLGQFDDAAGTIEQLPGLRPQNPLRAFRAAAFLTGLAATPGHPPRPEFLDRAMGVLRRLADRHLTVDPTWLDGDEFRPLAGRDDFPALRRALTRSPSPAEAKSDAPTPNRTRK